MSESAKKVIHTPEWNKNIGLSNKGKIVTTKQRETMSKAQKGKHNNYVVSDSTKIKISNTLKRYYENKRKTESI